MNESRKDRLSSALPGSGINSARSRQIDVRERLKRDLPWVLALVSQLQAISAIVTLRYGSDAHAYWAAWQHSQLYGGGPGTIDAYLYSPAFAQLIWPLAQLSWPAFATVYSLILIAVLTWLLRPLPLHLAIPFGIAGLGEVMTGNVFLIFAAIAVVGFRYPASWGFVALTKVTPCVGPVWFLVRREWRRFGLSLLATAAIGLISFFITPHVWIDWLEFLSAHRDDSGGNMRAPISPPLLVRLPVALALVSWGALKDKRWTVLVSMAIATPVFYAGAFVVLLGIPRVNQFGTDSRTRTKTKVSVAAANSQPTSSAGSGRS